MVIFGLVMSVPGQLMGYFAYLWTSASHPRITKSVCLILPTFIWVSIFLCLIYLLIDTNTGGGDDFGRLADAYGSSILIIILIVGLPINLIWSLMMYKKLHRDLENKDTQAGINPLGLK